MTPAKINTNETGDMGKRKIGYNHNKPLERSKLPTPIS